MRVELNEIYLLLQNVRLVMRVMKADFVSLCKQVAAGFFCI